MVAEPVTDSARNTYTIDALPIDQVRVVSSHNPRETFDEGKLAELADSIREHGMLQPLVVRLHKPAPIDGAKIAESIRRHGDDRILRELVRRDIEHVREVGDRAYVHHVSFGCDREVYRDEGLKLELEVELAGPSGHVASELATVRPLSRPGFDLIAGERRLRAAKLAGLTTVPVRVLDDVDDRTALRLALEENLRREDLDPIEEARALARLNRELGQTQRAIAETMGVSQPAIAHKLKLLELPADVQERIRAGELSPAHGVALAKWTAYPAIASKIAEVATERGTTSKELEGDKLPCLNNLLQVGLARTLARYLVDWDMQPCQECPHRRRLSEFVTESICLEPGCYDRKGREHKRAIEKVATEKVEAVRTQATSGTELPTLQSLGNSWDDYRSFDDHKPLAGCELEQCPKRIQALNYGKTVWACTDVKCWKRLEMREKKVATKAKKADVVDKLNRQIPEACSWIGAPLPDGGNREIGSRELAILAAYAIHRLSTDSVKAAFADGGVSYQNLISQNLAKLATLDHGRIVRCAVEAILRYEQLERLREYSDATTAASDFYLTAEARGVAVEAVP